MRLAEIQDAINRQKFTIWPPSHNFVGLYVRNWGTHRQSEKNLLNSNISPTCPDNMVNFGLLASTKLCGVEQRRYLHSAGRPSCWALAHILVFVVLMLVSSVLRQEIGWEERKTLTPSISTDSCVLRWFAPIVNDLGWFSRSMLSTCCLTLPELCRCVTLLSCTKTKLNELVFDQRFPSPTFHLYCKEVRVCPKIMTLSSVTSLQNSNSTIVDFFCRTTWLLST